MCEPFRPECGRHKVIVVDRSKVRQTGVLSFEEVRCSEGVSLSLTPKVRYGED